MRSAVTASSFPANPDSPQPRLIMIAATISLLLDWVWWCFVLCDVQSSPPSRRYSVIACSLKSIVFTIFYNFFDIRNREQTPDIFHQFEKKFKWLYSNFIRYDFIYEESEKSARKIKPNIEAKAPCKFDNCIRDTFEKNSGIHSNSN